jgi:purine-nucleoside phosphorylase
MAGNSNFVRVKSASKLAQIFDEIDVKYELAKTWTTDALYRETKLKAQKMRDLGCKVVDMECSSIMAMADFRKIEVYQFLYTDDTLESEEWDMRTLKDDRSFLLKECVNISLKVAKKI